MSVSTAPGVPFVFVSAMAIDVATRRRVPEAGTFAEELRIVVRRVEQRLAMQGLTLRDVVKTTCYLADEGDRRVLLETYKELFSPAPFPARCSFVVGLAGDCRVQMDVVAAKR